MQSIQCTVIGNKGVGKTCMLISYTKKSFPTTQTPTIFDGYTTTVDNQSVHLSLRDTAGDDIYQRIRSASYAQTNICLALYSVIDPISFDRISDKWIPELRQHCPNIPVILVATKIDKRTDPNIMALLKAEGKSSISYAQGLALSKQVDAVKFMECSALTQEGVDGIFEEAVRTVLYNNVVIDEPRQHRCTLL